MVLTYLTAVVILAYRLLRYFLKDRDVEPLYVTVLSGMFSVFKLVFDILVYTLFAVLYTFFYNHKRQAHEDDGEEMPRKAKITRILAMVLLALNFTASFITFIRSMVSSFVRDVPQGLKDFE